MSRRTASHAARRGRRTALAVAGAVAALVLGGGAGTAWAFLSSAGTGSAATSVGVVRSVTVERTSGTAAGDLAPGGSAPLLLTIANPNGSPVAIVGLSPGTGTVTVTGGAGCTAKNAGVTVRAQRMLDVEVPPGTHAVSVATGAAMSGTSANACQGASFRLPVSIQVARR